MDQAEFEGTIVLEKLAEINKVDDFFEAIDADDFKAAAELMRMAKIDAATISVVIQKMKSADGEH